MPIQATLTIFSSKNLKAQQAHMQRVVERFRGKASKSGQVSARVKKMARLSALMEAVPEAEHPASLHFPRLPFLSSGKDVLKIDRLAVGYEFPLMQPLNLF